MWMAGKRKREAVKQHYGRDVFDENNLPTFWMLQTQKLQQARYEFLSHLKSAIFNYETKTCTIFWQNISLSTLSFRVRVLNHDCNLTLFRKYIQNLLCRTKRHYLSTDLKTPLWDWTHSECGTHCRPMYYKRKRAFLVAMKKLFIFS